MHLAKADALLTSHATHCARLIALELSVAEAHSWPLDCNLCPKATGNMNFEILDTLECQCGARELHLREPLLCEGPDHGPVDHVLCRRFCGFRGRPISAGSVTPDDCRECRRTIIAGGAIQCACGLEWPIRDGSPQFSEASDASPEETFQGAFDQDRLRIARIHPRSDPRWRAFAGAHPESTIFHHPDWLQILTREYDRKWVVFACEDKDGRLHGVLPLIYTRGLPFLSGQRTIRRISSLPRTSVTGPLSLSPLANRHLLKAAVELACTQYPIQLEIKTQAPAFDNLVYGLTRVDWNPSYILQLPSDPAKLQLGNTRTRRHHIRGAVQKALNSGLQVRPAETEQELRAWYDLYLDTMRRRVVPARPYRLFTAMWDILRPRGLMELLLAEKPAGKRVEMLAGSIFLKFGATVCYAFTGCRREDFAFHPHDLIQWHAIHDAAKLGFRHYDFGEVAGDAALLANFKSKWGAEESPLYRYYYPAPRALENRTIPFDGTLNNLVRGAWQHLPLPATAAAADLIYSFL